MITLDNRPDKLVPARAELAGPFGLNQQKGTHE